MKLNFLFFNWLFGHATPLLSPPSLPMSTPLPTPPPKIKEKEKASSFCIDSLECGQILSCQSAIPPLQWRWVFLHLYECQKPSTEESQQWSWEGLGQFSGFGGNTISMDLAGIRSTDPLMAPSGYTGHKPQHSHSHQDAPPQGSTDCILLHESQASLNPGATAWTKDTNMASGLWWLPVPWWSLQKIQSRKQAFLHLKLLSLPGARGISWLGSRSRTKSSSADWYTPFHWSCWAVTAIHQSSLSRVTAIMSPVPPLSIVHAQLCFSVFPSFLHTSLSLWCLCIPESIF